MRWIKVKKAFIVLELLFIAFTVFFVIFIPITFGVFKIIEYIITPDIFIESLIILVLMFFGGLFVSLMIMGKILDYYDQLFECNIRYEQLKNMEQNKDG